MLVKCQNGLELANAPRRTPCHAFPTPAVQICVGQVHGTYMLLQRHVACYVCWSGACIPKALAHTHAILLDDLLYSGPSLLNTAGLSSIIPFFRRHRDVLSVSARLSKSPPASIGQSSATNYRYEASRKIHPKIHPRANHHEFNAKQYC